MQGQSVSIQAALGLPADSTSTSRPDELGREQTNLQLLEVGKDIVGVFRNHDGIEPVDLVEILPPGILGGLLLRGLRCGLRGGTTGWIRDGARRGRDSVGVAQTGLLGLGRELRPASNALDGPRAGRGGAGC